MIFLRETKFQDGTGCRLRPPVTVEKKAVTAQIAAARICGCLRSPGDTDDSSVIAMTSITVYRALDHGDGGGPAAMGTEGGGAGDRKEERLTR